MRQLNSKMEENASVDVKVKMEVPKVRHIFWARPDGSSGEGSNADHFLNMILKPYPLITTPSILYVVGKLDRGIKR